MDTAWLPMLLESSDSESNLASDKMSDMGWLRGLGNIRSRGAGHSGFKVMCKCSVLFMQTVNKDDVQFTGGTWQGRGGEKPKLHLI